MPSLFDQISGFSFPDVLMNSGPLPSTAGGPAGSNGSVDGVINGTSALLENITPYAIGKSARTGSDRNYQQIPHRYPYIIPKIWLPEWDGDNHIAVSHAVDQGDIAFLLYAGKRAWWTSREQFAPRAPQCAFAGIDVVNYILACIQMAPSAKWAHIRRDLIQDDQLHEAVQRIADVDTPLAFDNLLVFNAVRMLVQQYFVPHGICAGSEHQGGQHETGTAPVQAAVNFVITMTVDGKNIDLVNYWFDKSVLAGDELIFRLKKEAVDRTFQLSSYYKEPQTVRVNTHDRECWQLVPDIVRQEPKAATADICTQQNAWCHHRTQGYWRVAQTFQKRDKNNIHAFHRGMPLEVTFAPVWQSFGDCRDVSSHGNCVVTTKVNRFDHLNVRKLCSVTGRDNLQFYYADDNGQMLSAFIMLSSQNHYTIHFDEKVCKVYRDGLFGEFTNGEKIPKQDLRCIHITFDRDVKQNTPQNYKPDKANSRAVNFAQGRPNLFPEIKRTGSYRLDIDTHPTANVCEYAVTLTIDQTSEKQVYDGDFIRGVLPTGLLLWADNYWHRVDNDYVLAHDVFSNMVEYMPQAVLALSAPRAFASSGAARAVVVARPTSAPTGGRPHISSMNADISFLPLLPTGESLLSTGEGMNANADESLLPTGAAASDDMHVADFPGLGAFGAPEVVLEKPLRKTKKIKFLQPEPGAPE